MALSEKTQSPAQERSSKAPGAAKLKKFPWGIYPLWRVHKYKGISLRPVPIPGFPAPPPPPPPAYDAPPPPPVSYDAPPPPPSYGASSYSVPPSPPTSYGASSYDAPLLPPPSYVEQPPSYKAAPHEDSYGQPDSDYGTSSSTYSDYPGEIPPYGAPYQPSFRTTASQSYGNAPSQHSFGSFYMAPSKQPSYESSPPTYGAAQPPYGSTYGAPPQQPYEMVPQQSYGTLPQQSYEITPQQSYAASPQQPHEIPPQPSYMAPLQQSYEMLPQQSYDAPSTPQQASYESYPPYAPMTSPTYQMLAPTDNSNYGETPTMQYEAPPEMEQSY